MWNDYELPVSIKFGDTDYDINYRFSDAIELLNMFSDPDLLEQEKIIIGLHKFYVDFDSIPSIYHTEAAQAMVLFLDGNKDYSKDPDTKVKLYDWKQDFSIIVAPVNRILGYDARSNKDLHWWTFLSAFMEIGECTFSTFVVIRSKKSKHKRLDKWEEEVYKENKNRIDIKKKYDSTTQSIIDEIMGKKG